MGRPKGSKTSEEKKHAQKISKIIKLYISDVPISDIAVCVNTPASTIRLWLKPFLPILKSKRKFNSYGDFKVELFSYIELRLLQSLLSDESLSKANLQSLAYAFDKIARARRLEENKSTSNVFHVQKIEQTDLSGFGD